MRRFALLASLLLFALAGCGGSSGPSSTSTSAQSSPGTTTPKQAKAKPKGQAKAKAKKSAPEEAPGPPASAFHPKHHHDSGGGSAQFVVKGGDNSVQEYGSEASESELQKAAAALHGFLDARAQRNWAAACTYLAESVTQSFAQMAEAAREAAKKQGLASSPVEGSGCAATLDALSGRLPDSNLREAAIADVGALRVKGGQAFLIYRGAHGAIAAITMAREGGGWKVASLSGVPLG